MIYNELHVVKISAQFYAWLGFFLFEPCYCMSAAG